MRSHRTLARSSDGKQEADAGKGFQIEIYDGFEILRRTAALAAAAQKTDGERRLHRKRFKVSKSDPRPSSYCVFGNFRIAMRSIKKRVRNCREKQVTQLRREEFKCSAPSSEKRPPPPDLGVFEAGLLSAAGVPVTTDDNAPSRTDRGSAERDSFRLEGYDRDIVLLRVSC